jgi:hypothetical protein
MFPSPLGILAGAAAALAGLYLLGTAVLFPSSFRGGSPGIAALVGLVLIATGVYSVIWTWKYFFIDTRLPSPPKLFKEEPRDPRR